jgi:hypothetical protein
MDRLEQKFDAQSAKFDAQSAETRAKFDAQSAKFDTQGAETRAKFDAQGAETRAMERNILSRMDMLMSMMTSRQRHSAEVKNDKSKES